MCKSELTQFFSELTEFGAELSELSLPKQYFRNSNPPVSEQRCDSAAIWTEGKITNRRAVPSYAWGSDFQAGPKYHTKGCSHSSVDRLGARTLVFEALEPFLAANFGRQ